VTESTTACGPVSAACDDSIVIAPVINTDIVISFIATPSNKSAQAKKHLHGTAESDGQ
jgi:hypothetical protein